MLQSSSLRWPLLTTMIMLLLVATSSSFHQAEASNKIDKPYELMAEESVPHYTKIKRQSTDDRPTYRDEGSHPPPSPVPARITETSSFNIHHHVAKKVTPTRSESSTPLFGQYKHLTTSPVYKPSPLSSVANLYRTRVDKDVYAKAASEQYWNNRLAPPQPQQYAQQQNDDYEGAPAPSQHSYEAGQSYGNEEAPVAGSGEQDQYPPSKYASTGEDYEQHQMHQHAPQQDYYSPEAGYNKGQEISMKPSHKPITIHYRTHSQPISVQQTRIPGKFL